MIIDTKNLDNYKEAEWYGTDRLAETFDNKYSIFAYNVVEYSMGVYACNIAIYDNGNPDKPFLNSSRVYLDYALDEYYNYLPISSTFIFTMIVGKGDSNKPNYPYLVISPDAEKFAFIEWDYTSLYYRFNDLAEGTIILEEQKSSELDSRKVEKRTGEKFKLSDLQWYDFKGFADAKEIYLNS